MQKRSFPRLDKLSQDIYGLLKKREPKTVYWREIVEELWPKYKFNYANQRNFGVAISQKLKSLQDKHKLVQKKGDQWGTMKAEWQKEIERAIEHLRFVLMRDPKMLDIAYEIGKTPDAIRDVVFGLSPKIGWREPTEEQVSKADNKIKEIYKIASLLRHFDTNTILKRPSGALHGEKRSTIVERVKHARNSERDKLPKVVKVEEDEQRMELEFRWPKDSKWYESGDYPEYYYKKEKEFRGYLSVMAESTNKMLKGLLKEIQESRKSSS